MTRRLVALVVAVAMGGMIVGGLVYAVVDARSSAADHVAQARREQASRIDQMQARLDALTERLAAESRRAGRQEQALYDLRRQVRQLGGRPVTGSRRQAPPATGSTSPSRPSSSSPSSRPSSPAPRRQPPSPRPEPAPAPTPEPTPSPEPPTGGICLPLIGCL